MSNPTGTVSNNSFEGIHVSVNGPAVFSQLSFDVRDIGYPSAVPPASIRNSVGLGSLSAYRVPGSSKVTFSETDPTESTQGANDEYIISAATGALFQKQSGQWVQIASGPVDVSFLGNIILSGFRFILDMQGRIAIPASIGGTIGPIIFNYTSGLTVQ